MKTYRRTVKGYEILWVAVPSLFIWSAFLLLRGEDRMSLPPSSSGIPLDFRLGDYTNGLKNPEVPTNLSIDPKAPNCMSSEEINNLLDALRQGLDPQFPAESVIAPQEVRRLGEAFGLESNRPHDF